jgi:hypothetical protein
VFTLTAALDDLTAAKHRVTERDSVTQPAELRAAPAGVRQARHALT